MGCVRVFVCVCVSSVESFAKIKPPSLDTRTLREARASVSPTRLRTLAMGDIKTEEWAMRTGRGVVGMRERRQHTQKNSTLPLAARTRRCKNCAIANEGQYVAVLQWCPAVTCHLHTLAKLGTSHRECVRRCQRDMASIRFILGVWLCERVLNRVKQNHNSTNSSKKN